MQHTHGVQQDAERVFTDVPLATVVIGRVINTLLTLVVLPAIDVLFARAVQLDPPTVPMYRMPHSVEGDVADRVRTRSEGRRC